MCIANTSAEGISWKNVDMLIDGWAADIYQIFKKESINTEYFDPFRQLNAIKSILKVFNWKKYK